MDIQIRLLQENEIELANNFFNSIYNTHRSIENFRWEFLEGPSGRAIYVIAIDASSSHVQKVVGIQCAIPIELTNVKGEIVLTAKSEDTLVDPGYRGQKIFERMYDLLFEECKKSGIKYIWGFTPAKKAFERIGFEIPYQAQQGLMVFNPFKAYSLLSTLNPQNKFFDKLKIAGLSKLSFVTAFKRLRIRSESVNSVLVQSFTKTEGIRKLIPRSSLYMLNMTEKYIEWRIKKNPFNNHYLNYQFYKKEVLLADAIINVREQRLGYIEQLIFSEAIQSRDKKAVVKKLIEIMKEQVNFIRLLCFDINEDLRAQEEIFEQCGFTLIKRGGYFVWKNLNSNKVTPDKLFITRLFTQGNH